MLMDCDITEIPGADNLFRAESIIAETMEKYRQLYGAKKSYLLVNGSSGGLISSILASVSRGGSLVMARNCHKSIFNALSLGDIKPVYAYPETMEKYGILGEVKVEEIARCLDESPDAEAVIVPSPNYYGICSDIRAIAEEVHSRGKLLIVDQAHGAHLRLFGSLGIQGFPQSAEEQGADMVINSTHKSLASWTQSALLNVCSERVDLNVLEDCLQMIESSSPSYPMMATLDINAELLRSKGGELMRQWSEGIDFFYEQAKKIKGLVLMESELLDRTKLNIDMSAYGIDGNELERLLMEKGIFIELVTGNIVMCMSGIGNSRSDFERLLEALREIAGERSLEPACRRKQPKALTEKLRITQLPKEKQYVPLSEAENRICALSIIPYPPGIPIACPGELLSAEVLQYIKSCIDEGEKVIGVSSDGMVAVGK